MVKELKEIGIQDSAIGVISPYSAQVSEIRKQLKNMAENGIRKIEVSTVDGF